MRYREVPEHVGGGGCENESESGIEDASGSDGGERAGGGDGDVGGGGESDGFGCGGDFSSLLFPPFSVMYFFEWFICIVHL